MGPAENKLKDQPGQTAGENPFDALIAACNDDPAEIQSRYSAHRQAHNEQQRNKFLAPDFAEVSIDPILLRLENPAVEPGFRDPRHCMTIWARPPDHIVKLAAAVQARLRDAAPNIWLMPPHRMHLTVLEVAFSRTADEIAALVEAVRPALPALANYTFRHRARLVKPLLSYDLAAVALSFLPAAGEPVTSPPPSSPVPDGVAHPGADAPDKTDRYGYHHLRRDVYEQGRAAAGAEIQSRYVVPSAHVTLARFLGQEDHATAGQREAWVEAVDGINRWLESEVWGQAGGQLVGEWIVGQERGLDVRSGPVWYGGGRSITSGEGF